MGWMETKPLMKYKEGDIHLVGDAGIEPAASSV